MNSIETKQNYFLKLSDYANIFDYWLKNILISDEYLTNKRINKTYLLYPPFYNLLVKLYDTFLNIPINPVLVPFETFRSNLRQNDLFIQGATKIKFYGMHYYGIACDTYGIENENYTLKINWQRFREIAESLNLISLHPYEECHLQYIPVSQQSELRNYFTQNIKIFQNKNNLKVDGIAGIKTQEKAILLYKK